MGSFDHFSKLDIKNKTSEFEFHELEPAPILIVAVAGEANKEYFNAMLKKVNNEQRGKRKNKNEKLTVKQLEDSREEDREEYPKSVIKGWENANDKKGKAVEFSLEKCQEFVTALPDHMFDRLRVYCSEPSNFQEEIEAGEIAKNSQTASSGN